VCTTVVHNTAQNSSDNLPSYPPESHHCSDAVYWREGSVQLTCCAAPVVPTATCWSKRPMTRRRSAVTRRRQVDAVASSTSRRRCRCPPPPCRRHHRRRRSVLAHPTRPDAGRTPSADDEPAPACSAAPRRRLRREHDPQATTTTSGWSIDGTTTCSLPSLPIKQLPTLQTHIRVTASLPG